jgi:hypothetical protein
VVVEAEAAVVVRVFFALLPLPSSSPLSSGKCAQAAATMLAGAVTRLRSARPQVQTAL